MGTVNTSTWALIWSVDMAFCLYIKYGWTLNKFMILNNILKFSLRGSFKKGSVKLAYLEAPTWEWKFSNVDAL